MKSAFFLIALGASLLVLQSSAALVQNVEQPIEVPLEPIPSKAGAELSSRNKTKVLAYLESIEGKHILSGQQNLTWNQGIDMIGRVYSLTKKYPVIQGFDFMDGVKRSLVGATQYNYNAQKQVSIAQDWWQNAAGTGKKGLVTFCWHWRDPTRKTDSFYSSGQAPVDASLKIPLTAQGLLDTSTPLGQTIKADIDFVGRELLRLQAAGVVVLWRPLHEAAGDPANNSKAWFWWGRDGAAAYKALYRYMYSYLEKSLGLKNLIWVWNGQSPDFYPGDAFVDITAWDTYGDKTNGSQLERFKTLKQIAPNKLAALSEVGPIPDPDKLQADKAAYSWFVTWNDSDSRGAENPDNFWSGETWNSSAHKKKVYASKYVLTLDELPDFLK